MCLGPSGDLSQSIFCSEIPEREYQDRIVTFQSSKPETSLPCKSFTGIVTLKSDLFKIKVTVKSAAAELQLNFCSFLYFYIVNISPAQTLIYFFLVSGQEQSTRLLCLGCLKEGRACRWQERRGQPSPMLLTQLFLIILVKPEPLQAWSVDIFVLRNRV